MTEPVRPWSQYARDEWARIAAGDPLRPPETDEEPWRPTPELDDRGLPAAVALLVAMFGVGILIGLVLGLLIAGRSA